ncbi:MAG TPA: hypothetical protein VFE53_12140 [Mucilaginibacter sp.]|jgi:hypothetical protein|nr:hypothetical protein [Mucilaginibacter sp.]
MLKFNIQSLLSEKEGNVSGPMSPMLFAKEMALSADFKFNRLARVWFDDERINQKREDGGLTGHDTLIIGTVYKNDVWLSLWVDLGVGGMPIAMVYQSDNEVEITPVYLQEKYTRNLSASEIGEIFNFVFSNINQINIKQE